MEIPIGNSREEIKDRERIIFDYYTKWKIENPLQRRYNLSLKDYINIRNVSIIETSEHAAKSYLSTLAVLQLDAILTNSTKEKTVNPDPKAKNQNSFEKMILMKYQLPGIGNVKLTVGIKRSNKEKVQYCITVIKP